MIAIAQSSADFELTYNFQGTHIYIHWAHRAVIFAIAWLLVFYSGKHRRIKIKGLGEARSEVGGRKGRERGWWGSLGGAASPSPPA